MIKAILSAQAHITKFHQNYSFSCNLGIVLSEKKNVTLKNPEKRSGSEGRNKSFRYVHCYFQCGVKCVSDLLVLFHMVKEWMREVNATVNILGSLKNLWQIYSFIYFYLVLISTRNLLSIFIVLFINISTKDYIFPSECCVSYIVQPMIGSIFTIAVFF